MLFRSNDGTSQNPAAYGPHASNPTAATVRGAESKSFALTPESSVFVWPKNELGTEYPFTKGVDKLNQNTPLATVKRIVETCLDYMDPDVGNIATLMAEHLKQPWADKEIALLPKM